MTLKENNAWLKGYAAALSALVRTHGSPAFANVLMKGDGLTFADFKRAGVEKYDLDALRKASKETP